MRAKDAAQPDQGISGMSTTAHISLAQYELMAQHGVFDGRHHQRVELIRGEIREMNPIGVEHAMVVNYLTDWSIRSLPAERVWVSIQNPIRAPQLESAPEPDVAWVERKNYTGHPLPEEVFLLIEVADSTLNYDRGEKADLYAEARIADYWVVDCAGKCVEVMRNPSDGKYRDVTVYHDDDPVRPLHFPAIALQPSQLFKRQ
jgi:Uma2 family endonuclease